MREQEEAETPGMVLRKLSSQSFFENGMLIKARQKLAYALVRVTKT